MPVSIVPPMDTLQVERAGGVVTVTFDRPEKRNAINGQMWDELLSTVARVDRGSTEDRCVVLTGAGGAFCSGADLSGRQRRRATPPARRHAPHQRASSQAFHELPQPTIAKVTGVAAGVG